VIEPGDEIGVVQVPNDGPWLPHLHMELMSLNNYDYINFISHVSEKEVHEKEDWEDFTRGDASIVEDDDFYSPTIDNTTPIEKGYTFYELELDVEEMVSTSTQVMLQESQEVDLSQMDNEQLSEYFKEKYGDKPDEPFECPYGYETKNQEETVTDEVYSEEEKEE